MARRAMQQVTRLMSAAVLVLGTFGCIDWKQTTATPEDSVARFISYVQTSDGQRVGTLTRGAAPVAGNGAVVTAVLPQQVLRGGTLQTTVTSDTPFNRLVFAIPGINDHWELSLASSVTSVDVQLVISTEMPKTSFALQLAGGGASGVGRYQAADLGVIFVGTGEVQTNVTWNSKADVDLHVIDPSGKEIYYASRHSSTGGELDLDSNAGCSSDGPRAENIYWADGLVVPHGEYILRVDYWSSCGAPSTDYSVTINLRGKPPMLFSGKLTGSGSGGAAGAGKTIAVFNY